MTRSQVQALQQTMRDELNARPSAVYKCVAGIVAILVLSVVGPLVGIGADSVYTFASAGMLEHLAGIAN